MRFVSRELSVSTSPEVAGPLFSASSSGKVSLFKYLSLYYLIMSRNQFSESIPRTEGAPYRKSTAPLC